MAKPPSVKAPAPPLAPSFESTGPVGIGLGPAVIVTFLAPGTVVVVDKVIGAVPNGETEELVGQGEEWVWEEDEDEDAGGGPLQKPPLQELNAHWSSDLQEAWKLPQTGIRKKFTA